MSNIHAYIHIYIYYAVSVSSVIQLSTCCLTLTATTLADLPCLASDVGLLGCVCSYLSILVGPITFCFRCLVIYVNLWLYLQGVYKSKRLLCIEVWIVIPFVLTSSVAFLVLSSVPMISSLTLSSLHMIQGWYSSCTNTISPGIMPTFSGMVSLSEMEQISILQSTVTQNWCT